LQQRGKKVPGVLADFLVNLPFEITPRIRHPGKLPKPTGAISQQHLGQ
jgi:hypothetical protein